MYSHYNNKFNKKSIKEIKNRIIKKYSIQKKVEKGKKEQRTEKEYVRRDELMFFYSAILLTERI